MSLRSVLLGVVLFVLGLVLPHRAAAGLIGTPIWGDLQGSGSGEVITQLTSPQTVVDPGVEFTGKFTPNAAGQSAAIQLLNSFGISVDVSAADVRVTMFETGALSGAHINFGAPIRLNLTQIAFPDEYLTGITQTAGPSPFAFGVTGPTSIAIDFNDFSARTMDFHLTTIPEPATTALSIAIFAIACTRRPRRGIS